MWYETNRGMIDLQEVEAFHCIPARNVAQVDKVVVFMKSGTELNIRTNCEKWKEAMRKAISRNRKVIV